MSDIESAFGDPPPAKWTTTTFPGIQGLIENPPPAVTVTDRRTYAAQPGFPCPCHLSCVHRTPLPLTPCLLCLTGRCDHDR